MLVVKTQKEPGKKEEKENKGLIKEMSGLLRVMESIAVELLSKEYSV